MFKFISHDIHNAYFNLASEEYLLKIKGGYYFYLWVNEPAVIVGINQNTLAEVNLQYVDKNDIKVVRRLTGGGAVYHDLENICYTVIAPYNQNEDNYKKFTAPVIEYLNTLGVKAEFSGRNDITVDGKKISGNAQTIVGDKIMHHGTLLFKTNMEVLEGALKPNKLKVESKGIKSIRARVTNIYNELPVKMTSKEFLEGLRKFFKKGIEEYTFSKEDLEQIDKLVKDKYSTFDWNIGRSPKGKIKVEGKYSFGLISLYFDVENGTIINPEIKGDFFSLKPVEELEKKLNGVKYTKEDVIKALKNVDKYIVNANKDEIADLIFS